MNDPIDERFLRRPRSGAEALEVLRGILHLFEQQKITLTTDKKWQSDAIVWHMRVCIEILEGINRGRHAGLAMAVFIIVGLFLSWLGIVILP